MKIQSILLASLALFAVSCNSGTVKTESTATSSDIQYISTSEGEFPLDTKGFPEQETVVALLDEMDYQKGIQAYLWAMPQMVTEGQLLPILRYCRRARGGWPNLTKWVARKMHPRLKQLPPQLRPRSRSKLSRFRCKIPITAPAAWPVCWVGRG